MPDFGQFRQPTPGQPRANRQVPYDEKLLDDWGVHVVSDLFLERSVQWPPTARVAFFFHDLDANRPLETPFGDVPLSPKTNLEARPAQHPHVRSSRVTFLRERAQRSGLLPRS
jgi:hypothetical protein